jgi:hypothetical protein
LAVLQINSGNTHDSLELQAIDPYHAKQRAELFCQKLGIHLELEVSKHVKAAFFDDTTETSQSETPVKVKPAFCQKRRVI